MSKLKCIKCNSIWEEINTLKDDFILCLCPKCLVEIITPKCKVSNENCLKCEYFIKEKIPQCIFPDEIK